MSKRAIALREPFARAPRDYAYRIKQGGLIVARVEGRDWHRTIAEIYHYAWQYAQDGPFVAEARDRSTGRWVRMVLQSGPQEMSDE